MSYDNTCKYLAERYPDAFAKWLLGIETADIEVLKTELSQDPIPADSLTFLRVSNRILHLEFQTLPRSKPPLPLRMLDYAVQLKRLYQCPVVQIIIFLQQTRKAIAYTEVYQDETTIHRYRVIRLWEQDSALFLDNLGLLPLAPLTKAESSSGLLARVGEKISTIKDSKEKSDIASCTELLAGLRFNTNLIYQFLKKDIMKESSVYQDIIQTGKREEVLSLTMRLLRIRFGELEAPLLERIQGLSTEQLESLVEALLNIVEKSELVLWLNQQNYKSD
ncbi:hypothetical protein C7H19_11475 [Aphanothece hegewaldii CCALA 016]|uniref:DUF4351 domain-containing protein n=1 Tax=Aphanothece hegewaldii CCALA 016 TaxID=2107694 RepID=A0A2T1LXM6_9CHRO|nr:DUF4351 domain-containing protein [Aphanothece hegewaldii]PSF37056.1 hypothetical protein C7H19_11475 [Aphanothece hegewaldii CCALA 016]